jgi:hypothetical protein
MAITAGKSAALAFLIASTGGFVKVGFGIWFADVKREQILQIG